MGDLFSEMTSRRFYNDALSNMLMGFGVPRNVRFNTPGTKDLLPSYWNEWVKVDETAEDSDEAENTKESLGYYCVCRTVGIDPADVVVEETEDGLVVKGETTVKGHSTTPVKYSQYIELPIAKEIMDSVSDVEYESKNGLTYVYMKINKKARRNIPIGRISDANVLDGVTVE